MQNEHYDITAIYRNGQKITFEQVHNAEVLTRRHELKLTKPLRIDVYRCSDNKLVEI